VLAWRGEFHYEYGYFNIILTSLGIGRSNGRRMPSELHRHGGEPTSGSGIPFMMSSAGARRASREYYEAAEMDGAGGLQQWRHIHAAAIQRCSRRHSSSDDLDVQQLQCALLHQPE